MRHFLQYVGWRVNLFSRLRLHSKLRMCGATTLLLLYACMSWTRPIYLDWDSESFQSDERKLSGLSSRRMFQTLYFGGLSKPSAGPSGRAVKGVSLRPLTCWDCGLESHWGHRCLSVVSVVCCQVEVSATSCLLVQRCATDCGASLCVIYEPHEWVVPGPLGTVAPKTKNKTKQPMKV